MLCLSCVSQCSLGPSPCRGLQVHLLHRGGLLLQSGGLPLRSGGLLLRSGGLLLHLFQSGGLQLRRGGLLPRLLRPGGLQSRLLRPGGLQVRLLRPGGLQVHLLRPGFLLCLGPRPLHFHMDLALRPSPCSASAPPPSWIVKERLEAAPWGGGVSRILAMIFRSLTTRGHSLTTLTLALHYCCTSCCDVVCEKIKKC